MTAVGVSLPTAVDAERKVFSGKSGAVSYYRAAPESPANTRPLLLIHSVNAAASAAEIRPLFEYYARQRPVYALDLPGFGFSERSNREYSARLMTDAIQDVMREIAADDGTLAVDALALSLSCEFLARAAGETPSSFNTVALVSPTGFNREQPLDGTPESNRGLPWLYRLLTLPGLKAALFRMLASRPSIRYFLRKTFGSKDIDEQMFEYACLTAQQPGASNAPFFFLSGFLFSADIKSLYTGLTQPVWMTHGCRGDFTDYRLKTHFEHRANWQFLEFDSGALPYSEKLDAFVSAYDQFMEYNNAA